MQLFANNIETTLAALLSDSATSATVTDATGMPEPTGGDYFLLTLCTRAANVESAFEVVKVTARTGAALTIVRAQEGTSGIEHASGVIAGIRLTAGTLTDKMGVDDYALAVGRINNPLVHIPLKNSLDMLIGAGSVTLTRSTTATFIDRYGIVQSAAIDEARFEKEGLLLEGSSENKFLNSATGVTQNITVTDATAYTVYFLEGSGTITLSGAGSGVVSAGKANALTITTLSTILTCTVSGTCSKVQVEELPFASSYIPVTSSPVTRAADSFILTFAENMPAKNTEEMTILCDVDVLEQVTGEIQRVFHVTGEANRRFNIHDTYLRGFYGSGYIEHSHAMSGITRIGETFDLTNVAMYLNGIQVVEDAATTVTGAATDVNLGTIAGFELFGHVSNFRILDVCLTEEEMGVA